MKKIVVAMIVENETDGLLEMSLDSVAPYVDEVILIVGDHKEEDCAYAFKLKEKYSDKIHIITYKYQHGSIGADGHQRNQYLKYLKEHHEGAWCLVLDADEIVDDNFPGFAREVKKGEIESRTENTIFSPNMRHLIWNLATEDKTHDKHYCPCRFFKVEKDMYYPEVEHPILSIKGKEKTITSMTFDIFTIWHLGSCRQMTNVLRKYKNNLKKSNIHSEEFLKQWQIWHMLAAYPVKYVNPKELPSTIKKPFMLEDIDDMLYFQGRMKLEAKHLIDAWHWKNHFKPDKVLICGSGAGHRVNALNEYGVHAEGFDISQWIIDNTPYKHLQKDKLYQGDLLNLSTEGNFDLVVAYDLLEHLNPKDIPQALSNMRNATKKHIFISVPFIGDPNLEKDPTHKTKWTREQWEAEIIKAGFMIEKIPEGFHYKHQLIIARKE